MKGFGQLPWVSRGISVWVAPPQRLQHIVHIRRLLNELASFNNNDNGNDNNSRSSGLERIKN